MFRPSAVIGSGPGGVWSVAAVLSLVAGVAGLCAHLLNPALDIGLTVVGAAGLGLALHGQLDLRGRIRALVDDPAPRTSAQMLDALAARLATADARVANTHPVTRLPTREKLIAEITEDIRGDKSGYLLGLLHFSEFDHLAAFDDQVANAALARIAERIAAAVQDENVVSHIDRATFAIWFRTQAAREALEAIAYVARQQISVGATALTPSIRLSATELPKAGANAEQLLARAMAGLAAARSVAGSGGDVASVDAYRERFGLEQDLAHAIEQDQLKMVFQPVVNLGEGRLIGAEALLRWDHPTLGPVSPARFIPVVERLGLSDRYGMWVLNAACREAARWRAEGFADLRMAVNLSAQQVIDPALEAKIERTLDRHGLDARALELELTETAAMADAERTFRLFKALRAKGVGLAIDDFGAGYSSLSYLKNLPFTKLKIDREFVTGVDSQSGSRAICKALIELGQGLGLTVLAEGVEVASEVDTLRGLGCSVFQGFYFSRPLLGDAFLKFARRTPLGEHAVKTSRLPLLSESPA